MTCPAAPACPSPARARRCSARRPGLGADMVFLDLEDSVAPLEKEAARGKVVDAIKNHDWGDTVALRARQRVGHRVDVPRRHRGRRQRRRAARRDHAAEGAVGGRGRRPRPAAHPDREQRRPARRARRHRGADRDRPRAHQRRGDLRGVAPARDDHLRPGRLRGVDGDAGAHRRRADPRVPGRPLPLRVLEDPDGRAGQRPAGDRRPVPQDPRARRASATTAMRTADPRLRRQVGAAPRPGRRSSTRCSRRRRSSSTGRWTSSTPTRRRRPKATARAR